MTTGRVCAGKAFTTREHIRATLPYLPANLPAGTDPCLYSRPTDIRGYRVYPQPAKDTNTSHINMFISTRTTTI
jgi:hypothetical protein